MFKLGGCPRAPNHILRRWLDPKNPPQPPNLRRWARSPRVDMDLHLKDRGHKHSTNPQLNLSKHAWPSRHSSVEKLTDLHCRDDSLHCRMHRPLRGDTEKHVSHHLKGYVGSGTGLKMVWLRKKNMASGITELVCWGPTSPGLLRKVWSTCPGAIEFRLKPGAIWPMIAYRE